MEIKYINTKLPNLGGYIGAADECSLALQKLGFSPTVKGTRGAHNAIVYIPIKEKTRFNREVLFYCIEGTYRKFFFSTNGDWYYNVSYILKK